MLLEDYFNFLAPNDIRLKGSRVGIESVLYDYIHRDQRAEEIVHSFPSLSLEQIYATILYYWHNQQQVDAYLTEWLEWSHRVRQERARNPSPAMIKFRKAKAEWKAAKRNSSEGQLA